MSYVNVTLLRGSIISVVISLLVISKEPMVVGSRA